MTYLLEDLEYQAMILTSVYVCALCADPLVRNTIYPGRIISVVKATIYKGA